MPNQVELSQLLQLIHQESLNSFLRAAWDTTRMRMLPDTIHFDPRRVDDVLTDTDHTDPTVVASP